MFALALPVNAGTLACAVRTSACNAGEIEVYEMQQLANSHAGLPAAAYTNLVCCGGVTGLGNACTGTHATVLKLSGITDAHARQGTLADYPSATDACLSVPTGATVTVGYQATNCSGFDTTLGSMIGTTNSHVGDASWAAGTTKICATALGAGSLSVDIVDASGVTVPTPAIVIQSATLLLAPQTVTGTFGASDQRIRVSNTTGNPQWSMSIAAAGGPTALLSAGSPKYDFNDPTGGTVDGPDADAYGGQMTLSPSAGTLGGTCAATDITKGSTTAFSQGVTDSITLLTAGSGAATNCYWDFTGVGVSQTIPAEQVPGAYALPMTMTITAI